ncbi:MAG: hypothetical protein QOF28_3251 [Actinomycetota bacterium]|nr:hypothetical protein [Actinomycetota bacterium]
MVVGGSKRALAMCGVLALLTSGCAWMQRVSLDSAGGQAAGSSFSAAISADGRYVAFESFASNLVAGDTNDVPDVFVRDNVTGTTSRVSVSSAEGQGDDSSNSPAISADGRYVAFFSLASNLVAGDTNFEYDVFVRDTVAGTTSRASVNSSGVEGNGSSPYKPSISADGRYVAFGSFASNLVAGDTNDVLDVFVRDTVAGTTRRASVDSAEVQGNENSFHPAISASGRYVAFDSGATNLVPNDINGLNSDIFVRDTVAGTTARVSVDSAEVQGNDGSYDAAISADGRYVTFYSGATNLVAGDTNGFSDVFVRDTIGGTTSRVTVDSAEVQGNGNSLDFGDLG